MSLSVNVDKRKKKEKEKEKVCYNYVLVLFYQVFKIISSSLWRFFLTFSNDLLFLAIFFVYGLSPFQGSNPSL